MKVCRDEETMPDWQALTEMLRPDLLKRFKPAFLGVEGGPLLSDHRQEHAPHRQAQAGPDRKADTRKQESVFVYDQKLIDAIGSRCKEVESGARNIDHILTNTLLPEMSKELLSKMAKGRKIKEVKVSLEGEGFKFAVR